MKTLFKNLMKTLFVASMLFVGTSFAYAAGGEFINYDPMGGSHGITSVSKTGFNARGNSINVSIPQSGDEQTFKVYLAYQNVKNNAILYDAKATMDFDTTGTSSSTSIRGVLTGSHAEYQADSASIRNLPSSWSLQMVSAKKINTHDEATYPECTGSGAPYNYNLDMGNSFLGGGTSAIDHLDYVGVWHGVTGSCDQGYVVATFKVKNTTTVTPPVVVNVDTNSATSIGQTDAMLNGTLVSGDDATVWFVMQSGSSAGLTCNGSHLGTQYHKNTGYTMHYNVSGLNPGTSYYYMACAEQNGTLDSGSPMHFQTTTPTTHIEVETHNVGNYDAHSARLRGSLINGMADTWFVIDRYTNSLNCNDSSQKFHVEYNQQAVHVMDATKTGLSSNTHYHYKACARTYSTTTGLPVTDEGVEKEFTTRSTTPVPHEIRVQTDSVTGLGHTYATLNGELTSGNNVDVWFVFDRMSSNLDCTNGSQRVGVLTNKNAPYSYAYTKNNLSSGTGYHYMACAQSTLSTVRTAPVQGEVVDFITPTTSVITYNWNHGTWGSCIDNLRHRDVWCEDNSGNRVDDVNCLPQNRPLSEEPCSQTEPDPNTFSAREVTSHSAKLRGEVDMNDYSNGLVFFVYGQSENRVLNVDTKRHFDEIDEHGQNLQKVIIDTDLDGSRTYSKKVYGLESDERYYYQICVEYDKDGTSDIRCGGSEEFVTDNGHQTIIVDIRTEGYSDVTSSSARICGNLIDNGGNSAVLRWMEYRRTSTSWTLTGHKYASEGYYCTNMTNLRPNTRYYYRACTQYECGDEKYFTTGNGVIIEGKPIVTTDTVKVAYPHSAILPGFYVSHARSAKVWFNYGRSRNLGYATPRQTVYGAYGEFVHNFTNLKSNQLYCYQAVIETEAGIDYGAIKCFRTPKASVLPNIKPQPVQPVVEVVKEDETKIDLSKLGLGLSLIRLDIDDEVQTVTKGQNLTYRITWENISDIDLDNLDLNIEIPREVRITASSRGKLDQDKNSIFYTIDRLDAGEKGSMTVDGIVENGTLGDALTADATIAYDNPINRAQENAQDYDVDDFVVHTALGTASVFGLGNITLLGWLTILLGLFIVFLVARWLYLEREELRAQAYVNGYGRNNYVMAPAPVHNGYLAPVGQAQPVVHHYTQPVQTMPEQHVVHHTVAPQQAPVQNQAVQPAVQQSVQQNNERTDYRPYRPNRG